MDESDVYVDVHKAVRRLTPAPRARRAQKQSENAVAAGAGQKMVETSILIDIPEQRDGPVVTVGSYGARSDQGGFDQWPQTAIFMKRRSSEGPDGEVVGSAVPIKASLNEMKQQLRLGPANRAAHPRSTRTKLFKNKQGLGTMPAPVSNGNGRMAHRSISMASRLPVDTEGIETETTPLLGRASTQDSAHDDHGSVASAPADQPDGDGK